MTRYRTILCLVTASAAFAAAPAAAQRQVTVYGVPTAAVYVSYADLDLSDGGNVAALHARVRRAAGNLCLSDSIVPASILLHERACVSEAIAGALPQIERAVQGRDNSRLAGGRAMTLAVRR